MLCSLQNMQRILRGAILCYNTFNHHARVVKLVYTYALGAYAVMRVGSSPTTPTLKVTNMKKILCALLLVLISTSAVSQKVVRAKGCYDSNKTSYIKTEILNNTWKDIVCLVFTVEYGYTSKYDVNRYKEAVVKTYIESGTSKIITYYPPKNYIRPMRQTLSKVIFSDGSYKNF